VIVRRAPRIQTVVSVIVRVQVSVIVRRAPPTRIRMIVSVDARVVLPRPLPRIVRLQALQRKRHRPLPRIVRLQALQRKRHHHRHHRVNVAIQTENVLEVKVQNRVKEARSNPQDSVVVLVVGIVAITVAVEVEEEAVDLEDVDEIDN